MTLSDDDSDLSETLSSAGSTVPLPSSELASRAASEEPISPSGLASSSKNSFTKLDRRRKPRCIKSKNNHPFPTFNTEKDIKPKKPRPTARSNGGSLGSSSGIPTLDRLIKAESLPPLNLENAPARKNLSINLSRPSSAKGTTFELKSRNTTSQVEMQTSSNHSPRHPCTSHGHLPLFEQPVLVQGARPRRKPHTMALKSKKSNKGRKPRGYQRSVSKSHKSDTDQGTVNDLNQLGDDHSAPLADTFKDDESSLTEQSSSDEASSSECQVAPNNQTPSPSEQCTLSAVVDGKSEESVVPQPNEPQVDSSHQPQTASPNFNKTISPTPHPLPSQSSAVVATVSPKPDSLPTPKISLRDLHFTKIHHSDLTQTHHSKNLSNGNAQLQDLSTRVHVEKANGRNTSEESALTPEPEDLSHPSINQTGKLTLDFAPKNTSCHPSLPPSPPLAPNSQSLSRTCTSSPPLLNLDLKKSQCSLPITVSANDLLTPGPSVNYQKSRPPNIIPPSILQPDLKTGTIVDRTVEEGEVYSVPSATDCTPASPFVFDNQFQYQPPGRDGLENLTDEALDGEPITDDLMEYELELGEEEPSFDRLLNHRREPSEAGTSAVDGIPVPDSEDVMEDLEMIQPPIEPPPLSQTCGSEHDFPHKPKLSPQSEEPLPEPRTVEKLKQSKNLPPEVIYEHDDQVRRREDALEAMVKIEIMFAQVRDRLYAERMADVHRETAAVQQGSHPELNEYYQMLERKRDARLSLAHKIFSLKENELNKKRDAATSSVWNKWHEVKTELHHNMIIETQKQMKQLEREKRQPDLRYNVEVQLLPRPIIPRLATRKRTRKRARLELDVESEEILAIELHTAIAKRSTVKPNTLTAEESWADLSVMKPHSRNAHLDPINILCAPHALPGYFYATSEPSTTDYTKKLSSVGTSRLKCSSTIGDRSVAGGEKHVVSSSRLSSSRPCQSQHRSMNSASPGSELSKHPLRLNSGLDSLSNVLTSSSRTGRNPLRSSSERIESEPSRILNMGPPEGYSTTSDRRPTLDSVMANNHSSTYNTPERTKGASHAVTYTLTTTACLGSSSSQSNHHHHHHPHPSRPHLHHPLHNHHHHHHSSPNNQTNPTRNHSSQIYPSGPISVNYHERAKTQIA